MRTIAALFLIMLLTCPAHAGLYNTADTLEETMLSRDYDKIFRFILGSLRTIPDKKPDREPPIRKRYLLLEALGRKGTPDLTLEEQLNYSAVLIRRGKADEAVQFLDPIARERDEDFILQAQFAMANFQASTVELQARAADIMEAALQAWPDRFDNLRGESKTFIEKKLGWEQGLFDQHRKYEVYFHKLVKARRKKKNLEQPLDPIFDVKFASEDGSFAVGHIADAEKAKLPRDAIEIVEQLLVWLPNDVRLLRLLAEVFNATAMEFQKDIDSKNDMIRQAAFVMRELDVLHRSEKNKDSELFRHKEYIEKRAEALEKYVGQLPPGRMVLPKLPPDKETETPTLSNEQWWRTLLVGIATGAAVGVFALWQVQEWRRRRQRAA